MSDKRMNWRPLGTLKYVIGGILVLVGIMGGLEALVNLWSFRGIPEIDFFAIAFQLSWGFGNAALLMIGLLYIQQGEILFKPTHQKIDSTKIRTSRRRTNFLILIALIISVIIIYMSYLSSRELVEFFSRFR